MNIKFEDYWFGKKFRLPTCIGFKITIGMSRQLVECTDHEMIQWWRQVPIDGALTRVWVWMESGVKFWVELGAIIRWNCLALGEVETLIFKNGGTWSIYGWSTMGNSANFVQHHLLVGMRTY